ncbi:MAG: sugar transferase [Acidobacteriaceae bacterium]|nr:sugar transferase [Acidobacteriaceae bacterium]
MPQFYSAVLTPTLTSGSANRGREFVERSAGAVCLVLAAPVLAGSAAVIALLSGRSPFIAHRRVGQSGRDLWMLKLRTMWDRGAAKDNERGWVQRIQQDPEAAPKVPWDARICSRFAAFCRRHSIDELPQLWHVVRGDMAFVGPRPLTATEIDRQYASWSDQLLQVKPGLTGLWQVSGRSTLTWEQRVHLDRQMVRTTDWKLYATLLLKTVGAILGGRGAW